VGVGRSADAAVQTILHIFSLPSLSPTDVITKVISATAKAADAPLGLHPFIAYLNPFCILMSTLALVSLCNFSQHSADVFSTFPHSNMLIKGL